MGRDGKAGALTVGEVKKFLERLVADGGPAVLGRRFVFTRDGVDYELRSVRSGWDDEGRPVVEVRER